MKRPIIRTRKILSSEHMDLKTAESLYEEYKIIYEEKNAKNNINEEEFFLNSLEIAHQPPFNETSYEVLLYAIKEGKVITFTLENAIRVFGKEISAKQTPLDR